MSFFLRIISFSIMVSYLFFIFKANAITTLNQGFSVKEKISAYPCYILTDVSFKSDVLTLLFTPSYRDDLTYIEPYKYWVKYDKCKNEVYFSTSWSKVKGDNDTWSEDAISKIRGVNGLSGKKVIGNSFSIDVLPDTDLIQVDMAGHEGKLSQRFFDIRKEAIAANASDSNWQNSWKEKETALKEIRNADQSRPKIILTSPEINNQNISKTDSYTLYVRGQVTDEEGILNILVKGKKVSFKEDGSFASKLKLGIGRNDILIQAEDINGNVSEKKLVIIRTEFLIEENLADVDIPIKTNMKNNEGLAVVIGVENYQYVPDATYAYNDAEVFREYLTNTLGYNKQRIKLATNSKATQAELYKLLGSNGWLARNIVKDTSDIIIYFSGHGIANQKANTSGLLPYDVDPNYSTGILLNKLYKDLASMEARSITVFLDACFTGQTRNEEMLVADTRPIKIVPIEKDVPSNITVLSATSSSEVSGALKEKEHGLFTYYLLKGMAGKADENKDNNLDITELSNYVIKEVKEQAALSGREQTPQIIGDNSKLLIQY